MPKSGTHSIAGLFSARYRAAHEPEFTELWHTLFSVKDGLMSKEELSNYVRKRDKRLWLELDSSNLNAFLIDILLKEFDQAKFILPVRDCYSWLASAINHRMTRKLPPDWKKQQNFRFGTNQFEYAKEEELLKQYQLPTIDAYLACWAEHHRKVLETVPEHKLLVIRTHEISTSCEKIASFVGVPVENLNQEHSHMFKTKSQIDILSEIGRDFIEGKVDEHCKDLMSDFFSCTDPDNF
jgi:hypothetical protein